MRSVEPHPIQVRLAFGGHGEQRAEVAEVVATDGGNITVRCLRDSVPRRFQLSDETRLEAVLRRPDVCRLPRGHPLALVNARYRLVALAVGPAHLPEKLVVNAGVVRLENGVAVEMPSASPDQPSWHIFVAVEVASSNAVA